MLSYKQLSLVEKKKKDELVLLVLSTIFNTDEGGWSTLLLINKPKLDK